MGIDVDGVISRTFFISGALVEHWQAQPA